MDAKRPLIALTAGDPAGIGPEIVGAAIHRVEVRDAARVLGIGPASVCPKGVPIVDEVPESQPIAWLATPEPPPFEMARAQASCGQAALDALRVGHDLATARRVDALVTAPVCKESLHLAGERVEGQTELLARWAGTERYEMLGISGALRVMLATRHLPLAAAIAGLRTDRLIDQLRLLTETLRGLGISEPRVALAGLNPHASEGGLFGNEERDILEPAVNAARDEGLNVVGPISPDSVFLAGSRGELDGILALYHDQAFIPLKLLSGDHGLTLIAGLPYLRVSPVHGTAFDIAGKGVASPENLVHALLQAAEWAARRGTVRSDRLY